MIFEECSFAQEIAFFGHINGFPKTLFSLMIPSNILDIFSAAPARDLSEEPACLGCQVTGAMTCLIAGGYFASNLPFKGDLDYKKSPKWFRGAVRGCSIPILALGVYRGGEGWLWNKDLVYKPGFF